MTAKGSDGTVKTFPSPADSLKGTGNVSGSKGASGDGSKGIQSDDVLTSLQMALDVAGLVPGFGEVADGLNALISLARGDYVGAGLSAAAMIPFLGWGATVAKGVRYGLKATDALSTALKYGDEVVDVGKDIAKYAGGAVDMGKDVAKYADEAVDAGKGIAKYADEAVDAGKGVVDEGAGKAPNSTKPYTNSRPSYGKTQVDDVWNSKVNPQTGTVRDPSGADITWDRTTPRKGQWDMGHIPGQKYSDMHSRYMKGEISQKEFLEWYRNPTNYRPEDV